MIPWNTQISGTHLYFWQVCNRSLEAQLPASSTLKKEHIKPLRKLVGPEVRSIATVIIRKVSTNGQQVQKSLQFLNLGWAIKKLRFSFQLPKRTSCNDDDGTNYKTTRRNFTLGHQMPKTSIPYIPLHPPLQELGVKIAESRRTFAELPINVNANCQPISWPVRSVLMFINWPAMAQLSAASLAKMIRRLDLLRN